MTLDRDALFIGGTWAKPATDAVLEDPDLASLARLDAVFLATPHGVARKLAGDLEKCPLVLDLSADHRHAPGWVYGQPEWCAEALAGATRVALPGCFATAMLLSAAPLVAAGALSSALVPVVTGLFTSDERARAWRVVSTVINLMLIGLAVLAVAFFLLAPVIVPIITPGFDGPQLELTIQLTRIMLLSPIFLALGAVATSVLNAGGRFAAAAVAPIVYNLAIIGAAVALYGWRMVK